MFRLLSACLEYSRAGEGAFDITVGPLMKVWGFYKGSGHLPHRAEVQAAMTRVGYRHILLDPAALIGVVGLLPVQAGDGAARVGERPLGIGEQVPECEGFPVGDGVDFLA